MTRTQVDIFISGGGIAGLICAAAFAHSGYSVLLADPQTPDISDGSAQRDLRSTAYLQPAQALLADIGIWRNLDPIAVPLDALRIVDTTGTPPQLRDERAFRADDLGQQPFGWNILNWEMLRQLRQLVAHTPNITLRYGVGFRGLVTRTTGAFVTLSDNSQISARLVVGADGRNSRVRDAAGIAAHTTRYGQKSLAFSAAHLIPHENISTEIYHRGGPFTMVPLADVDGLPASAIVWMNEGRRTHALAEMGPDDFNREMTERAVGLFGPMRLISDRAIWPIITQRAARLTAERTVLIAEAAHVLPPIGAQGLNTSIQDIAALIGCAQNANDLGDAAMLASYSKQRDSDIRRRARVIDLFNRVTRSGDTGLQAIRLAGLKAVHDIAPLRHQIMRRGMGATYSAKT